MHLKINNYPRRTKFRKVYQFLINEITITLFLVLLIRIAIYEPFYVPTGSMMPNIMAGEWMITTKYNYGYSKYSIPFFPDVIKNRVLQFYAPKKGDVIVFYYEPKKERFVKRVIGIPGDRIQMIANELYINDKKIDKTLVDKVTLSKTIAKEYNDKFAIFTEKLPNGKEYMVRYANSLSDLSDTSEFLVPENSYFVLGDNRDESADSRVGFFVNNEQIIAKAQFVVFSNEYNFYFEQISLNGMWEFIKSFRTDRFFKKIA